MSRASSFARAGLLASLLFAFAVSASAQASDMRLPAPNPPRFVKAFVVDDRLSALRREADLQSMVVQRLRLGRTVFIIGQKSGPEGRPKFYRVAVTRRTRGWIHEAALAVAARAGEDERVAKLIEALDDEMDKVALSRLFIERFGRSPFAPRVLFRLGEQADRAASALTRRAQRRLGNIEERAAAASLRDYYLNDPGLDRYSRLKIRFDFDAERLEYFYDGEAYREIIRRFPKSEEAARSRERVALIERRLRASRRVEKS